VRLRRAQRLLAMTIGAGEDGEDSEGDEGEGHDSEGYEISRPVHELHVCD
jgi:hypothetical protein